MSALASKRPSGTPAKRLPRRETSEARAKRIAAQLEKYGHGHLNLPPVVRYVPDEERIFAAIGDPRLLNAPMRMVNGRMVSTIDTCRMRRRAYALMVLLARRLAGRAAHAGFAAMWRGVAREALYGFHLYTGALRQARAEHGR